MANEYPDVDFTNLASVLGDQDFLFGTSPTGADFSVVPILSMVINFPQQTDLIKLVTSRKKLTSYIDKGRAALYPNG